MFDKKVCLDNIRTLAKEKGIKLGELEEQAGVSTGYISRIDKSESYPSLEFILKTADILSVSIDYILNSRLSVMNATDLYIARFTNKLIIDTNANNLNWEKEEKSYLKDKTFFLDSNDAFYHPLFTETKSYAAITNYEYNSMFHDPRCVSINGDCYHCEISYGVKVYLMSTEYNSIDIQSDEFEMYIVNGQNNVNKLICVSEKEKSDLFYSIKCLYELADESSKHANLPFELKTLMDNYMES